MKLIEQLKALVKKETEICVEILQKLREVEDSLLYARMKYESMHAFCVGELGYSDGAADRRVKAMRLIKVLPKVEEKILSGAINLTTAACIQRTFIAAEAKNIELPREEILASVDGVSTREAEKRIKAKAAEAGLGVAEQDDEFRAKLKALLAHFSHKHPGLDEEGLFRLLVFEKYAAIDPKRERKNSGAGVTPNPEKRHVPAKVKREVFIRDEGQCTFRNGRNERCEATHFLEVDHIAPFAKGGLTKLSNLRLLCRTHNRLAAQDEGLKRPSNSAAGATDTVKAPPAPEQSPLFH